MVGLSAVRLGDDLEQPRGLRCARFAGYVGHSMVPKGDF